MTFDTYLSAGAVLLGAFLSWFFGGLHGGILVLLTFMIIDQITGVMKGYVLKRWSSDVGFNGIARKVCMFFFVGIANILDKELHIEFLGHADILRDGTICFYIANEGLSIIENAIELGVPVPQNFKERFLAWHNRQLISKNTPDPDDE